MSLGVSGDEKVELTLGPEGRDTAEQGRFLLQRMLRSVASHPPLPQRPARMILETLPKGQSHGGQGGERSLSSNGAGLDSHHRREFQDTSVRGKGRFFFFFRESSSTLRNRARWPTVWHWGYICDVGALR